VRSEAEEIPMHSLWRLSLLAGLFALSLALLPASGVLAQDKDKDKNKKDDNIKPVSFPTYDGVKISGKLYKNSSGKRDAVVILLHDFTEKGGKSEADNLPALAEALYEDGYSVLTFDFRGFGESKEIRKETFWKYPDNIAFMHNVKLKDKDLPETIDHKNFKSKYYIWLINDIAAAKAFLDRASDRKDVNSHNTVVIGAGRGATLGALWVANEANRRKDKRGKNNVEDRFPLIADEPEAKDIAACVWLGYNPDLPDRNLDKRVRLNLKEVAATVKVPMAFYYGKDAKSDHGVGSLVKELNDKTKDVARARAVEGVTGGGGALVADEKQRKAVLKELNGLLEGRARENVRHASEDHAFYYVPPGIRAKTATLKGIVANKKTSDEVDWVNLKHMLLYPTPQ